MIRRTLILLSQCFYRKNITFLDSIQQEKQLPFHYSYLVNFSSFSSNEILLNKLENAIKQNQLSEACEVFADFKRLHGFPSNLIISKLITQLSYSFDSYWLKKGYDLVLLIYKQKSHLLCYDFLAKLAISLARDQVPIHASTVLRIMLELGKFPTRDVWKTTFIHMVKTETGTYLVSDLLVEICDCFMHHMEEYGVKNSKHLKMIKPDTMIFNIVLEACVRFKSTLRAEQIIELMAVVGVVADASTIVLIAQIHEMNGQRDELKKLKCYIDRAPARLLRHYRQFYDSLLSLHFKFDDIDAAVELVLDMCKHQGSSFFSGGFTSNDRKDLPKTYLIPIGSCNLKTELRLQIEPELLQKDYVLSVGSHPELATFLGGRLFPSNKALAKVIHGYRKHGKIGDLSKTIVSIQKGLGVMQKPGLSSDMLGSCIQIRWLETSHDILDDMELAGTPMDFEAYLSLLSAYCKENMMKEAKTLIKQMRKRGWLQDLSDEDVVSGSFLEKCCLPFLDENSVIVVEKSGLAESLIRELKEGENAIPSLIYEINTSIYFFCKGNMMDDALRTYQRMQEREIQPTVQTFTHLINGYSKLKMYREITILWGEIKRKLDSGDLTSNRDLHEMLLWNFIRGGYFERVLEVLDYMKRNGMYIDKWKYKSEFMKFHKYLYRSLKEEQTKTEAQRKRLEHVRAFRKWVGID
ncbi:hypothetical protein AQUCO_00100807v1 [Aquilegia coerulea]|uniref:At1g68980-like TPR repeats domain-containing protein n=1 Tax=Aquilegia coerulea TaxID=218851 RepID=A0A2G5FC25_AQUCA|nr:hypothetical protein AQUCO_00100807v1 [Aquilegia coerulea]